MISLSSTIGSEITSTIRKAIGVARQARDLVRFDFNGVKVQVADDSDPDLIYRDWSRAMSGYIPKVVGPYPPLELSPGAAANDARIEAENEARRAQAHAKYEAEAAAKRAATGARLAVAPPMDVADAAAWQSWKDSNSAPYGSGAVRYAEAWARLMQAAIANGAELEDVADETSHAADVEGVTGFMVGAAVHGLARFWVHGERLRRWHNRRRHPTDGAEGTVGPAVITIGPDQTGD